MPATHQRIDRRLLGLYLKDHLAGATAGVQRIQRMARAYASTPIGAPLDDLARQLTEDRDQLLQVIDALHMRPGHLRSTLAAIAERLGRLKLNGRLVRKSPLSPLLETELARSAVIGKMGLWQTLTTLSEQLPLARADYEALTAKATRQLKVLDQIHIVVSAAAFTGDSI